MNECHEIVSFTIDRATYGVPVGRVREILDICPVSPVPRAPDYVMGLIDVRGENIPVIDMRSLLRLPAAEDTPQTRFLVAQMHQHGKDCVLGIRNDRVIEVARLDDDTLRPMAEAELLGWSGAAVGAIGRRNGAIISILDLDNLFAEVPSAILAQQAGAPDDTQGVQ